MRNILRFHVVAAMVLLALGLFVGSLDAVGAQGATPITSETGALAVTNFACTQIQESTAAFSEPVGVSDGTGKVEPPIPNCVPDSASFQIFLNNDFTAEPFTEFDAGTETINGIPMSVDGVPHLLLEVDTNVFFEFSVESGATTRLTILSPAIDDYDATPVANDDGTATEDTAGRASNEAGATGINTSGKGVTVLPSTGQGADSGTSTKLPVFLFLGAISIAALLVGFVWRQRRTA